ncbi:hypothetical protein ELH43_41220 [Rhizobium ruizarguesonis]|nr:hypothetical protein ELH43_41220 [Rhizobium ruizarguesonis]
MGAWRCSRPGCGRAREREYAGGAIRNDGTDPQTAGLDPGPIDDKPERFQISLSGAVIIAAKLEALRQKTTAGEITERALRSYLRMLPKA